MYFGCAELSQKLVPQNEKETSRSQRNLMLLVVMTHLTAPMIASSDDLIAFFSEVPQESVAYRKRYAFG